MKRLLTLILASLLFANSAGAQTSSVTGSQISNLCGLATPCGDLIASINVYLTNGSWLKARNALDNADINVLRVDATDDTQLNADTGDVIKFSVAGTTEMTLDNDKLTFSGAAAKVVPGATSFTFANNADNASNLVIADAGSVTARGQFTSTGLVFPTANEEAVAGAGTTVADAAALSATKHIHQLTGANGTVGWKFATSSAGQFEFLLNTTAGVPKIYAASGGTCNGGAADAACTLVTGIVAHICYSTAADTWICA